MEQILNEVSATLPSQGLLEKLMCRGNDEIHYSENNIHWCVEPLESDGAIKSHTAGTAVANNARGSAYSFSLTTPFYITKRAISADDIISRASATEGYSPEASVAKILGNDLKWLSRDLIYSVEKQASLLLSSTDVEYVNDQNATINVPTYSGSDPCAIASVTAKMDSDAMACITELVAKAQAKGFQPDVLILGSSVADAFIKDSDIQSLIKANVQKPGLIELTATDGGSFLGTIGTPNGARLEVYSCNEASGGTPLVGADSAIILQSGCCVSLVGVVPVPKSADGKWEMRGERLVPGFVQGEIDQTMTLATRCVVVPATHAWGYCADVMSA